MVPGMSYLLSIYWQSPLRSCEESRPVGNQPESGSLAVGLSSCVHIGVTGPFPSAPKEGEFGEPAGQEGTGTSRGAGSHGDALAGPRGPAVTLMSSEWCWRGEHQAFPVVLPPRRILPSPCFFSSPRLRLPHFAGPLHLLPNPFTSL